MRSSQVKNHATHVEQVNTAYVRIMHEGQLRGQKKIPEETGISKYLKQITWFCFSFEGAFQISDGICQRGQQYQPT
jgi:hypothetical protein